MTPRRIDDGVIRSKLDALSRARTTLTEVGPVNASRLNDDAVIAAAVERILCRMVDLAVDINAHISATMLGRAPGDYRESFEFAAESGALTRELADTIKPSVGMRNTIVHEYLRVDYAIVAAAVPMALEAYAEYGRQVAGFVYDRISGPEADGALDDGAKEDDQPGEQ